MWWRERAAFEDRGVDSVSKSQMELNRGGGAARKRLKVEGSVLAVIVVLLFVRAAKLNLKGKLLKHQSQRGRDDSWPFR